MLGNAIYASGLPLSFLDNIYWKKLFEKIRPVLPSYQLLNKLLDSEVNGIKCFVEKLIVRSHYLGLMGDEWSNIRNESIINFVITTPKPVFYKSLPTLTERRTGGKNTYGVHMAKIMIEIIEEARPGKVFGIVTDNVTNMKKTWREINNKLISMSILQHMAVLLMY